MGIYAVRTVEDFVSNQRRTGRRRGGLCCISLAESFGVESEEIWLEEVRREMYSILAMIFVNAPCTIGNHANELENGAPAGPRNDLL